ncbi:hypothetical protein BJ742DRAFT_778567 [Cladochytrium replicatum]|nr:hypothetical protein BJ742DRAFT_778567 [Cladochytrium replicatum]
MVRAEDLKTSERVATRDLLRFAGSVVQWAVSGSIACASGSSSPAGSPGGGRRRCTCRGECVGRDSYTDYVNILELRTFTWLPPIHVEPRTLQPTLIYRNRLYVFGGVDPGLHRHINLTCIDLSDSHVVRLMPHIHYVCPSDPHTSTPTLYSSSLAFLGSQSNDDEFPGTSNFLL